MVKDAEKRVKEAEWKAEVAVASKEKMKIKFHATKAQMDEDIGKAFKNFKGFEEYSTELANIIMRAKSRFWIALWRKILILMRVTSRLPIILRMKDPSIRILSVPTQSL